MSKAHFIHLRVHSEYSLLEGAVRLTAASKPYCRYGDARRGSDRHQQYVLRVGVFRKCRRRWGAADYWLSGGPARLKPPARARKPAPRPRLSYWRKARLGILI